MHSKESTRRYFAAHSHGEVAIVQSVSPKTYRLFTETLPSRGNISQDARRAAIKPPINDKDLPPRPITSAFNPLPVCAGNEPTLGQSCSADDTVGTVPFGRVGSRTMEIDRFAGMNGCGEQLAQSPWDYSGPHFTSTAWRHRLRQMHAVKLSRL